MHRKLAAPATFSIDGGPEYQGYSFGACKSIKGEVAFTTSLVGYTESLTDPSYEGQILVFTQPLIGNHGVPDGSVKDEFNLSKYFESPNIHVAAVVVADYAWKYSHWTAVRSLAEWCIDEGVPAIGGIDTRAVVQFLRDHGACLGRVDVAGAPPLTKFVDSSTTNLVAKVSTKQPFYLAAKNEANAYNVALIDCGVKENILRCLVSRGANVLVLPYNYDICSIANQFDGIFISNGPGDPSHCMNSTVANLRKLLCHPKFQNLPIFGICMGHQLLALAAGASIEKMKYGNRAHNIPTLDLTTGMCYITSQNHGYVVDAATVSERGFVPYFINLNDKTNEGLIHTTRPVFSTQFHPEAKGGPHDSSFLFDRYFENMKNYRYEREHVPQLKLMVSSLSKSRILQYAATT